jgi:hypothetical protein
VIFHRFFAVGTLVLSASCSFLLSGCKPAEGIHQVNVPAEFSERRDQKATVPPATTSETPASASLKYKTPDGWTVKPNGPMRLASLDIIEGAEKCDVSLIRLGPDQPVLDNVNRWRGQIKLAPAKESELEIKPVRCGSHDGKMVQLVGETESILAVTVSLPDATWFVKLQGPKALAQRQLEKFVAFTESIELP